MDSNGGSGEAQSTVTVDQRKLFVGGLSQESNEETVKEYFGQYGAIESINLKTDSETGNSRGFAFIVFSTSDAIDAILAQSEHNINNKKVDVQRAKTKQGKLFVGGITAELTGEDIKDHFSQFGNVISAEFPFDKTKNERKRFCFIVFDTDQTVKEIVKTQKQTIKNIEVDVKRAVTNPEQGGRGGFGGGFRGRGGGFRGGRGSRGGGGGWNRNSYDSGYGGGYDQGYGGGYGGGDWNQGGGGYGGGGWDQGGYGGGYNSNAGGYGGGFQGKQRGGAPRGRGRGARHQPY